MDVWVVIVGEPLPNDSDKARLYRKGQLAEKLVAKGHNVVLWSSTVNHMLKTKRAPKTTTVHYKKNYEIILLDAPLYTKNISFKRIIHNLITARAFKKLAQTKSKPDIIICSYPPIELADAVSAFGKKNGIPTILDNRDLWPDIFTDAIPKGLRWLSEIILYPLNRIAKRAFTNATAITGITDSFVAWAAEKAGRQVNPRIDRPFYLSYNNEKPNSEDQNTANTFWDNLGVESKSTQFIACMMGNLGFTAEIDVLVRSMQHIDQNVRSKIRIVICGTGMAHNHLKSLAKDYPEIILPGWMSHAQLWTLLQRSTVGTLPYLSTRSFQMSIPNKVGEYLSAGLPILSSIRGELSELLEKEKCGLTYENQNPKQLALIMMDLMRNPERVKSMSDNASRLYQKSFNSENVYKSYVNYIEKISKLRTY